MLAMPDSLSWAEQEMVKVVDVSPEVGETVNDVMVGGVVSETISMFTEEDPVLPAGSFAVTVIV